MMQHVFLKEPSGLEAGYVEVDPNSAQRVNAQLSSGPTCASRLARQLGKMWPCKEAQNCTVGIPNVLGATSDCSGKAQSGPFECGKMPSHLSMRR